MNKLFYIFAIAGFLFSVPAFAKGNVFCEGKESSDLMCIKISQIVYQGFLEGYSDTMVKYRQKEGLPVDKQQAKVEAMKLVSYDSFYKYFRKCGEEKGDLGDAQACMMGDMQKDLLEKLSKEMNK